VYEAIKGRVWALYPNFNVGVSTAAMEGLHMRLHHPYRHWLFVPSNAEVDPSRTKKALAMAKKAFKLD